MVPFTKQELEAAISGLERGGPGIRDGWVHRRKPSDGGELPRFMDWLMGKHVYGCPALRMMAVRSGMDPEALTVQEWIVLRDSTVGTATCDWAELERRPGWVLYREMRNTMEKMIGTSAELMDRKVQIKAFKLMLAAVEDGERLAAEDPKKEEVPLPPEPEPVPEPEPAEAEAELVGV